MKFSTPIGWAVSLGSAALLAFLAGMVFSIQGWPPNALLVSAKQTAKEMIVGPWVLDPRIVPRRYKGDGIVVYEKSQTYDGLTLVQAIFEGGDAVRLYSMDGEIVHEWEMDFFETWPDPKHIIPEINIPKIRFGYHTQGMVIDPDGSLVVNYAEYGTVKYDVCGGIVWKLPRMTHHSIFPNPDGSYWIPTKLDPRTIDPSLFLPGVSLPALMNSNAFYADSALLVSPDGEVLREVPVLENVIRWLAENQEYQRFFDADPKKLDPLHLNDIKVVSAALAAKIPNVQAGNLLMSLRNQHALVIADEFTGEVKWMKTGPWIRQHDPDVTPDGMIEVFDNGINEPLPGRELIGSRILRFDPADGTTSNLYPVRADETFFSWIMGAHQSLPNGNRLITESMAGRVFEVTPDGDIVWSLVMISSDKTAAIVSSAERLAPGYVSPGDWTCP